MQSETITFPFEMYHFLLHSSSVICLFMGIFALTQRDFKTMISRRYFIARYLLGIVFIVFAIDMGLDLFLHHLPGKFFFRTITRVIILQTECTLSCLTFFSLIDFNHFTRKRILIDSIWWLFTSLAVSTALTMNGRSSGTLLYIGIASLGIYMTYSIGRYIILSHNFHRIMNNYHSNEIFWLSRWMRRSIILLGIYGYIGLTNLLTQIVPGPFYVSYELFVNVFVFIAFQNFRLKYKSVEEAINMSYTNDRRQKRRYDPDSQEFIGGLSPDNLQRLDDWVLRKGYRRDITIHQLAVDIGTNRFYLSQYINQKHGCNFNEWINRKRVEDAKSMFGEKPDMTIKEVALALGFSSGSYFSKIFAKIEGKTPGSFRRTTSTAPPPHSKRKRHRTKRNGVYGDFMTHLQTAKAHTGKRIPQRHFSSRKIVFRTHGKSHAKEMKNLFAWLLFMERPAASKARQPTMQISGGSLHNPLFSLTDVDAA